MEEIRSDSYPKPTIYIFGTGDIAPSLAMFSKEVGFRVVVMDNDGEFANRQRFPHADEIIVDEFSNRLKYISLDESSYLVIMTRGHLHDGLILEWVLKNNPKYIGLIGSKIKIQRDFFDLEAKGFSKKDLERVNAPIGLPIKARTPQEIAVSILAEIIQVRRSEEAMSLEDKKRLHMEIVGDEGEECL